MEFYRPNHLESDYGYTALHPLTGFNLHVFNYTSLKHNIGDSEIQIADFDKFNGQLGGLCNASLKTHLSSSKMDHHLVVGQVTFELSTSYLGHSWDKKLENTLGTKLKKHKIINHDSTLVATEPHNPVSLTLIRLSASQAQIVTSSYIDTDESDENKYTDLTAHIQLWGDLMDMGATLDGSHHLDSGQPINLLVGTSNQLLISDTELAMLCSSSITRGRVPIRSDVISKYEKQFGTQIDPVIIDQALELLRDTSATQLHVIEALKRSAKLRRQWLAENNHHD